MFVTKRPAPTVTLQPSQTATQSTGCISGATRNSRSVVSPFLGPRWPLLHAPCGHLASRSALIAVSDHISLPPALRVIRFILTMGKPQDGRDNFGANWRNRDVSGPVQGAVGVERGPQGFLWPPRAMTALCSTNVPGPCGPDKEEFAVKLPMPLPISPA